MGSRSWSSDEVTMMKVATCCANDIDMSHGGGGGKDDWVHNGPRGTS